MTEAAWSLSSQADVGGADGDPRQGFADAVDLAQRIPDRRHDGRRRGDARRFADTGHTLRSVHDFCEGKVAEVRTGVLYEKSHSVVKCDYIWKRTDQWINFPWSDKDPVARREWSVKDA